MLIIAFLIGARYQAFNIASQLQYERKMEKTWIINYWTL